MCRMQTHIRMKMCLYHICCLHAVSILKWICLFLLLVYKVLLNNSEKLYFEF